MATKTRLDLPFRQARGDGGRRALTQLLVIHATDNLAADNPKTAINEAAENEAAYASHRPDQISAHVYIDDDSAVQGVALDHIAFGCYPTGNMRSIQLELAGRSGHLSASVINRAAQVSAVICGLWGLPIRKVSAADMRAGRKGICGHVDVTTAWHTGRDVGANHTDPGNFPWPTFLGLTASAYHSAHDPVVLFDTYTTITGDRLDLLARTFYGDPGRQSDLMRDNKAAAVVVLPGTHVRIRRPHKPVATVAPGDTAWDLARKHHISLSLLAEMNKHRVHDLNKISVGLILRVG
jgi:hypothetical protein